MEQNANNRLLNEKELEKVSGGAYMEYPVSYFTCIHCGSNMIHAEWADPDPNKLVDMNMVEYCGGCGRPLKECRKKSTPPTY